MRVQIIILTVIAFSLFLSPSLWAKTLYLKNGAEIECLSYRKQGNTIFVLINRDTEIDFALEEVDLNKTANANRNKSDKKHKVKRAANTKAEPRTQSVAETTEQPPKDTTWWGAGEIPAGYRPGTPQLQNELSAVFGKYNRAAQDGDFDAVAKYMPSQQAQRTMEALAKVKDKKDLLERKKTLQGLAVKDFQAQKCAVSPDGKIAALAGKGKKQHGDNYQEAKGTVKFMKETSGWKVSFQIW